MMRADEFGPVLRFEEGKVVPEEGREAENQAALQTRSTHDKPGGGNALFRSDRTYKPAS
jgi:hypothetical protein